ncbi:MAG: hypothetical protein LPK00_07540 [Bacillaceae bacterium]|nr:hypothetical protein [Bacillaceae bacterium]
MGVYFNNYCCCKKGETSPDTRFNTSRLRTRLRLAEANIADNRLRINALQAAVARLQPIPVETIGQFFTARLNTTVTFTANIGTVTGTVMSVGVDAVEIMTPTGDILIVPFRSVVSI